MTKEIINIDCDLIRELRLSGQSWEAQELLNKWRENVNDNKRQLLNEMKTKTRNIKKHQGFCSSGNCNSLRYKWGLCKRCYDLNKMTRIKLRGGWKRKKKLLYTYILNCNDCDHTRSLMHRVSVSPNGAINQSIS